MQRYFSNEKNENSFILNKDDWFHIKNVMRMKNNDKIEVVYEKQIYLCELINDSINIIEDLKHYDFFNKEVIFIIPVLKEQKMDYILQKATELGVKRIIPVNMERCVVKTTGKEEKKIARWTKIVKEASEQSMRNDIPEITNIMNIQELKRLDGIKMLCSTAEKQNSIKNFLHKYEKYDKINIVVGPEGGISTKEEELLKEYGFEPVTLGNKILRVETVPLFVLSILNYDCME